MPNPTARAGDATDGEPIAVAVSRVTGVALATVLGVDERSIYNYAEEGMPRDERGAYPLARCVQWYVDRERASARASKGLNDLDRARLRKTEAEADKAEHEAALLRAESLPMVDHEDIVGDLCDRLRAITVNIPTTYGMRLEEAGVSATVAEETLGAVAGELMTAMRGVADELDALAIDDAADQSDQGDAFASQPASHAS